MVFVSSILTIIAGVFFIWLGSFQLITAMVPKEVGIQFAEKHGAWIRENVFNLPPVKSKGDTP